MLAGVIQSRPPRQPARSPRSQVISAKKISFLTDARGKYRIFNAAVYRFYRSNSTPPVPGDTPFATNASLPHEPTDVYADGTWYLSVSYFNGIYDSGFLPVGPLGETYVRMDLAAGVETTSPPAGPLRWHIENVGGGVVRIVAVYAESSTLRASQWAAAYTVNGSTPATDTPDVTQAMDASGLAVLTYDLPAQANGTTVKVRLQTRRFDDPSYTYSEDSEVQTITADASGPAVVQLLGEGG
jgi:hypothetical protein